MRKFEVDSPLVYLITDGAATAENFIEKKREFLQIIARAVEVGVSLIQIREKRLPARMVFELASEAARLTEPTATRLLINDRADIALAASADGVHLTAQSLSAKIIRRQFPKNFLIGVSAHTVEAAERAKREAADFVTFSPIFDSPGKGDPQGVIRLRQVCESLKPFPVIALGGINAANLAQVTEAGASGFAAIRFLNNEQNLIAYFQTANRKNRTINS